MKRNIFVLIVVLVLGGCMTSPEVEQAAKAASVTETLPTTELTATPPAAEPLPPAAEPEPPSGSEPAPCEPSDVHFGNGTPTTVIPGFRWGETYQVEVKNISANCSFTASFLWYVYDGSTLRWSGECCYFTTGPGAQTVNVRIPSFEITPPACDLAVLAIRVIPSN